MIPLFKVHMPNEIMEPLKKVLMSGFIGQGKKVAEFEEKIAPLVGTKNALSLNSCTSAIHLALRLANVGPGDEVISTPMTCTATNEPVLERGAKIVWADINPKTGNIDPESIRKKITDKTKAIICVHWGGYPCDLDEINTIARQYGIKVIEDAAHAFGSSYKNDMIGSHSDFVCFSFQAIKHITTVDGGLLCCKSSDDYKRGKLLRWYGIDREDREGFRCEPDITEHGYKFHMNDVAATIGICQLNYLPGIIDFSMQNAKFYDEELKDIPQIELLEYEPDRRSAYWIYSLLVDKPARFIKHMKKNGIQTSPVHKRNDKHTMMEAFRSNDLLGVDEFERQVSIPVGWWITSQQRTKIIEAIKNYGG